MKESSRSVRKIPTRNSKYVRKVDIVTICGYITKVFYGRQSSVGITKSVVSRNAQQNSLSETTSEGKEITVNEDDYVIGEFRHCMLARHDTTENNRMKYPKTYERLKRKCKKNIVIKGQVPYHAPYFGYVLECTKGVDPKRGTKYLMVVKILDILRCNMINYDVFTHIVCVENDKRREFMDKALNHLNPQVPPCILLKGRTPVVKSKLINSVLSTPFEDICPEDVADNYDAMVNSWLRNSEYVMYEQKKKFDKLFPEHSRWLAKNSIVCTALENTLKSENDSWKLRFKAYNKTIHPQFKPKCDVRKHMDLSPKRYAAVCCYEELKKRRKASGDTFFTEYDIPQGYMRQDLNLLCTVEGLISKEDDDPFLGETVYRFSKDLKYERLILDFYKVLHERTLYEKNANVLQIRPNYVPDSALNQLQKKALASVEVVSVVNVTGYPGCGKTRVICELYKKYENVVVLTGMASMVDELKRKGIEDCKTIHMALYEKKCLPRTIEFKYKDADQLTQSAALLDELAKYDRVEVLIIDEFEDVSTALASKLFCNLYDNLKRVVQVFDPLQIAPIKPGRVALECMEHMPDNHTVELKERFRFKPRSSQSVDGGDNKESWLAKNDVCLVNSQCHLMSFDTILVPEEAYEITNDWKSWASSKIKESEWLVFDPLERIFDKKTNLLFDIDKYLGLLLELTEGITFQCLALTNECCNIINAKMERKCNPSHCIFYKGQKINVRDGNFYDKSLAITNNPQVKKSNTCKKESEGDDPLVYSSGVKNGEFFTVECIRDYYPHQKSWGAPMESISLVHLKRYDQRSVRRCIVTSNNAFICINDDYVPYTKLKPGWCITVDRSKGREYDNVILCLGSERDLCFQKNHIHVGISRSKEKLILLGDMNHLTKIAGKCPPNRKTTLGLKVAKCFSEVIPDNKRKLDAI